MTTLRAATSGGGARRREAQSAMLHALYEGCTQQDGFLLPKDYASCNHEGMYVCLDSGYSICSQCGSEHFCCCGKCPEIITEHNEHVCAITGCVTLEGELNAERNINERCGPTVCKTRGDNNSGGCSSSSAAAETTTSRGGTTRKRVSVLSVLGGGSAVAKKRSTIKDIIMMKGGSGEHLRNMVESTVREILQSDKTRQCMLQERKRNECRENSILARAVREAAHDKRCLRPNMLHLVSQVVYHCRKNRRMETDPKVIEQAIEECTESITNLLIMYGGPRVVRQMNSASRYREFICSMLYLMRVGITFQNRQILPRMGKLHRLLPLQVLLPSVFKIRAKSITEGENMVKMDIKNLPI